MAVITNEINERTADAGVTIDGVLIKDGDITGFLPRLALQRSVAGNHTLEAGDAGYMVRITAAGTVTLPDALAANVQAVIRRATANEVALSATTLNAVGGGTKIPDEHGAVLVVHQGSGVWDVYGELEV
jgi:hypothetical protein